MGLKDTFNKGLDNVNATFQNILAKFEKETGIAEEKIICALKIVGVGAGIAIIALTTDVGDTIKNLFKQKNPDKIEQAEGKQAPVEQGKGTEGKGTEGKGTEGKGTEGEGKGKEGKGKEGKGKEGKGTEGKGKGKAPANPNTTNTTRQLTEEELLQIAADINAGISKSTLNVDPSKNTEKQKEQAAESERVATGNQ